MITAIRSNTWRRWGMRRERRRGKEKRKRLLWLSRHSLRIVRTVSCSAFFATAVPLHCKHRLARRQARVAATKELTLCSRLPVCVRVCLFKSNVSLKPLPQKVHRYRLTSEWHLRWRFSRRAKVNLLPQIWHLRGSSVLCRCCIWDFDWAVLANRGFLIPWPPLTNSIELSKWIGRPVGLFTQ